MAGGGLPLVPSGPRGSNYTGMLTRSIVFSTVLFVFLAATGMTIAAIIVPNWLGYESSVVCRLLYRGSVEAKSMKQGVARAMEGSLN